MSTYPNSSKLLPITFTDSLQGLPTLCLQLPLMIFPFFPLYSFGRLKENQKLSKQAPALCIPFPLISDFLSKPLFLIFNEITEVEQFPQLWKRGFIAPFKNKDAEPCFEGVHPISLQYLFFYFFCAFVLFSCFLISKNKLGSSELVIGIFRNIYLR